MRKCTLSLNVIVIVIVISVTKIFIFRVNIIDLRMLRRFSYQ